MENKFKYTFDNKRYQTYNYYLKTKYNSKVFKVGLNAGFTCPNRDGLKASDGCIFCSASGAGDFGGNIADDIINQFHQVKEMRLVKWPNAKYIGYFQAFSNTYDQVEKLKELYEPILEIEKVVGLNISTRPDCFDEKIYDYLEDLSNRTDLWIELGLQSSNDNTLKRINRGHTFDEFKKAVVELRRRNINVCVHIINGLPNETEDMMTQTIKDVVNLDIQGIKIHMLHIVKDTVLNNQYQNNEFELISKEKYIDIVIQQLELIPEEVVIMRLTGDSSEDKLVAPDWILKKVIALNDIDKEMAKRDTYQGRCYDA